MSLWGNLNVRHHVILSITPPQILIHDHGYYIIVVTIFVFIISYNNDPSVSFLHSKALVDSESPPVPRKSQTTISKGKTKLGSREDPEKAY